MVIFGIIIILLFIGFVVVSVMKRGDGIEVCLFGFNVDLLELEDFFIFYDLILIEVKGLMDFFFK